MSASRQASAEANTEEKPFQERRRRKRAKISAQVHVKGGPGALESFEEICMSVDVSRDGLLFATGRSGYFKGQRLKVTFPYSAAAAAINTPQTADVVRVAELSDGGRGVAVEFKGASKPAEKPEEAGVATGANAAARQSVVLAVEPDARLAESMRNFLSQDGYTVVVVPTAQEALEVLRTTVPAVFVAEVEGEEMTGIDLCSIIKRNERLAHVPVILLTRSAQPADYSTSHSLGAVVCMAKPFKPERLLHVIRLVAPPPSVKPAYGARLSSNAIERSI